MNNNINRYFLLLFFSITFLSCAQDRVITKEALPVEIKTFISTHFTNTDVAQVTEDNELFSKTYEVILKNGVKLEFDKKNKIKDIDGNSKLPNSVIPKSILTYVTTNYANNFITDWELDDGKQKVNLDNGLELEFTKTGKFLRIDD